MEHRYAARMRELKMHVVLRQLISKKGISAREVARSCGLPQSTLTSFLSGRGMHKPEQVLAVAQFFGVSMETLLFGEDLRPPTLSEVATTEVFEGWLKVKIEKALPLKKKANKDGSNE